MDKTKIIPYSGGPKRLAFQIRKFRSHGSTSMLITNRFGVWSVVRHRHIKKTRYLQFHKLKNEACSIEKLYVSLRKLGLTDEHIMFWRHRLADVYWNALSPRRKDLAIDYFRDVRRNRRILHFVAFPLLVLLFSMIAFYQVGILINGKYPMWFNFCAVLLGDVVFYKTGVDAWRDVSDLTNNVVVRLLDHLACRREQEKH